MCTFKSQVSCIETFQHTLRHLSSVYTAGVEKVCNYSKLFLLNHMWGSVCPEDFVVVVQTDHYTTTHNVIRLPT